MKAGATKRRSVRVTKGPEAEGLPPMPMSSARPAAAELPRGLACIRCGCRHLPVVYTRPKAGHILRLRECRHCGRRIITRERV